MSLFSSMFLQLVRTVCLLFFFNLFFPHTLSRYRTCPLSNKEQLGQMLCGCDQHHKFVSDTFTKSSEPLPTCQTLCVRFCFTFQVLIGLIRERYWCSHINGPFATRER